MTQLAVRRLVGSALRAVRLGARYSVRRLDESALRVRRTPGADW